MIKNIYFEGKEEYVNQILEFARKLIDKDKIYCVELNKQCIDREELEKRMRSIYNLTDANKFLEELNVRWENDA